MKNRQTQDKRGGLDSSEHEGKNDDTGTRQGTDDTEDDSSKTTTPYENGTIKLTKDKTVRALLQDTRFANQLFLKKVKEGSIGLRGVFS